MSLTWDEFKKEFPPEIWGRAIKGFDEQAFAERMINKARAWLKARLEPCGLSQVDEDDEVIKQILLYRAQYEFYAFFEKETIAQDKKESAEELLRSRFGTCVDNVEKEDKELFYPYAYVTKGKNDWRGFSA